MYSDVARYPEACHDLMHRASEALQLTTLAVSAELQLQGLNPMDQSSLGLGRELPLADAPQALHSCLHEYADRHLNDVDGKVLVGRGASLRAEIACLDELLAAEMAGEDSGQGELDTPSADMSLPSAAGERGVPYAPG